MKGLFVTATDTNVGKTWVGTQLIKQLLESGVAVQPRKPVESGWLEDISQTDAWLLANTANKIAELDVICPNRFDAPISPDRAAQLESKILTVEMLHQQCVELTNPDDFLYVEGAGGFYSPMCTDGLNADLATSLQLPVLLVVEDRLGCINHTLLSIEAIKKRGLEIIAVVLNSPQDIETIESRMNNFEDLQKHLDCPVFALGHNETSNNAIKELSLLVISKQL